MDLGKPLQEEPLQIPDREVLPLSEPVPEPQPMREPIKIPA